MNAVADSKQLPRGQTSMVGSVSHFVRHTELTLRHDFLSLVHSPVVWVIGALILLYVIGRVALSFRDVARAADGSPADAGTPIHPVTLSPARPPAPSPKRRRTRTPSTRPSSNGPASRGKVTLAGRYELLEDFHPSDGGTCKVAAAEYQGRRYFVKQFLSPKYPVNSTGTAAGIARRRKQFLEFESRQNAKLMRISRVAGDGGRVVVPVAQFREGSFWYAVAPWVDTAALTVTEIAALSLVARLVIITTVASAARALHAAGIVHGDLKPANILITRTGSGGFHANVIDFDSSYFEGDPPSPDQVKGDQPYYSPELLSYIQQEADGSTISRKSDVFALGVVFCEYLSAERPGIGRYTYTCEAVRAGLIPRVPSSIKDGRLVALLGQMLLADPAARPSPSQVIQAIKAVRDRRTRVTTTEIAAPISRIRRGRSRGETGVESKTPQPQTESAPSKSEQVLSLVASEPGITVAAVARQLHVSQKAAAQLLSALENDGGVKKEGQAYYPATAEAPVRRRRRPPVASTEIAEALHLLRSDPALTVGEIAELLTVSRVSLGRALRRIDEVLIIVENEPGITFGELAEKLTVSYVALRRLLSSLELAEFVAKRGTGYHRVKNSTTKARVRTVKAGKGPPRWPG